MHAEEEDVPEYLRTKKPGPSRALAIVAIGSVITGVLMLIFAKPVVIDVAQLKKAIRFADQPVFDEPARFVEQAPMPQPISPQYSQQQQQPVATQYTQHQSEPSSLWVPRGSTTEQKAQERQRSFNNQNYTPKNPINIVAFENQPSTMSKAQASSNTKVTIIGQPDRKDICDVWKAGSIERRECRQQVDLNSRNNH
jgi:hypothetical protein